MTRDDLEVLEAQLLDEVAKRRRLGGYSMEAAGILQLFESVYKMVQHMKDSLPRKK